MKRATGCWALAATLLLAAGCGREPFPMVRASGRLTYEDGTPLPMKEGDALGLMFIPQIEPLNPATHPRRGSAIVDPVTGTFDRVTTRLYGDGLIRGKYKVAIYTGNELSPAVPPEYCDPETTPLEVDASRQPMHLKIRRPEGG